MKFSINPCKKYITYLKSKQQNLCTISTKIFSYRIHQNLKGRIQMLYSTNSDQLDNQVQNGQVQQTERKYSSTIRCYALLLRVNYTTQEAKRTMTNIVNYLRQIKRALDMLIHAACIHYYTNSSKSSIATTPSNHGK